jgi:hypothetical protein
MNTSALQIVMNEARKCAAAMLESGTYIGRELPNVRMDDPVRVDGPCRECRAKHTVSRFPS